MNGWFDKPEQMRANLQPLHRVVVDKPAKAG
jgi:hypothetical protein